MSRRKIEITPYQIGVEEKLSGWDARSEVFHTRSREGYLKFSETEPGWVVVDGMKSPEEIAGEIYQKTTALINNKNAPGNT